MYIFAAGAAASLHSRELSHYFRIRSLLPTQPPTKLNFVLLPAAPPSPPQCNVEYDGRRKGKQKSNPTLLRSQLCKKGGRGAQGSTQTGAEVKFRGGRTLVLLVFVLIIVWLQM